MLVLVIETSESSCRALENRVRQLDILVMCAGNISAAMQLMRATAIEVIMINVEMISRQTLESLNELAAKQPRYIGITTDPDHAGLAELRGLGLGQFITPEPDQEQLRQVLLQASPLPGYEREMPLMEPERLDDLLDIARISGRESVQGIVLTFLQNSERRMDEIRQALNAGDQAALRRIRHGWAGIAGSLGAGRLTHTLQNLDPVEMLDSTEYSNRIMLQLRREFDDTREFFDAFVQELIEV